MSYQATHCNFLSQERQCVLIYQVTIERFCVGPRLRGGVLSHRILRSLGPLEKCRAQEWRREAQPPHRTPAEARAPERDPSLLPSTPDTCSQCTRPGVHGHNHPPRGCRFPLTQTVFPSGLDTAPYRHPYWRNPALSTVIKMYLT